MPSWQRFFKVANKTAAVIFAFQLVFSPVIPVIVSEVAQAQEVSAETIDIAYSSEKKAITLTVSPAAEYSLYYKSDQLQAVRGRVDGQEDLFLGICSTNDCVADEVERGVIKIEMPGEIETHRFVLNGENLEVIDTYKSTSMELDADELRWVEEGELGVWQVNDDDSYTLETVKLFHVYTAPQNDKVSITFTSLPETAGSVTIREVQLTEAQQTELGALSDVGYDITSNMEDGSFTYDLTLPNPQPETEPVDVKYSEDGVSFEAVNNVKRGNDVVKLEGLDHFTVFVVTSFEDEQTTDSSDGYNDIWFTNSDGVEITRVPSGTNGIDSSEGSYHAEITGDVFTRWGEYRNEFPKYGYDTRVDVYFDMSLADGTDKGFDFSSAINNTSGNHRRDFIFNIGTDPDNSNQWLVSASNNAPGWPGNPARNPISITESGWYTLESSFRDKGGILVVTMNIYKKGGNTPLGSWELSTPADVIGSTIGGNRYGWFTGHRFDFEWLAVDYPVYEEIEAPDEVWVDDDWNTLSNGDEPEAGKIIGYSAFASVQEGIDYVANDGTVHIRGGEYQEQLIVNKNVSIIGYDTPQIVAPDSPSTFTFPGSSKNWQPIIFAFGGTESDGAVSGSEVVTINVSGLEINGNDRKPSGRAVGILYRNAGGVIKQNLVHSMNISNQETFGLMVYGDSNVEIASNTITGYSRGGIGVNGDNGELPDPVGNVHHNEVTGPGRDFPVTWAPNGIQMGSGASGYIDNNTVMANGWPGDDWSGTSIMVVDTSNVEVTNNTVKNSELALAVVDFPKLIYGSDWTGIVSDVKVEGNTVTDSDWGLAISNDVTDVNVVDNTFDNISGDAIDVYVYREDIVPPSYIEIHQNSLTNIGVDGLWIGDEVTDQVQAQNNWWGDASGPSGDASGSGATVVGNAQYCPWLDAEKGNSYGPCLDEEKPSIDSVQYYKNGSTISQGGTAADPVLLQSIDQLTYDATFSDDFMLDRHTFVIYQENPNNPGTPYWTGQGGTAYCGFNSPENTFELDGTTDSLSSVLATDCEATLPDGRYVIVNRVYDEFDKFSESYDLVFEINSSVPEITWVTPTNGQNNISGDLPLEVSCNGTDGDCDYINFWWWSSSQTIDDAVSNKQNHRINTDGTNYSWTLDTLSPEQSDGSHGSKLDGEYTLRAAGKDLAGNYYHEQIVINIDNTAPSAPNLLSPDDKTAVKGVSFSQTWEDVTDAVEYEYQSCNDNPNESEGVCISPKYSNIYYSAIKHVTAEQPNSHFWWRVKARDEAGNWSAWSQAWELIIDNESPTLSVDDLPEFINSGTLTLNGAATDIYDAGIDSVEYKIENLDTNATIVDWSLATPTDSAFDREQNEDFSITTSTLSDGLYRISVRAIDAAGNESDVQQLTTTVDSTEPVVDITSHENNAIVSGIITIVATITEENLSHYNLSVYKGSDESSTWNFSNREWQVSGNNTSISQTLDTSSFDDGEYMIRLAARDLAGNRDPIGNAGSGVSVEVVHIVIDNTDPISEITFPANEGSNTVTYENTWDGLIQGEASDENNIAKVELVIQRESDGMYFTGSDWSSSSEMSLLTTSTDNYATWSYDINPDPSPDEIYYVTSHATDLAGNYEESYELTVVFDQTIPEVSLTVNPTQPDGSNGWYKTKPQVTLAVADSNYDSLQYKWDDGEWISRNETSVTLDIPSQGSHVLHYSAFDKAGNTAPTESGVKTLRWDEGELEDGPTNLSVSPNPTNGTTAIVQWDEAADDVTIDSYEIIWQLNDTDVQHSKTVNSTTFSTQIDELTEGEWTVKVKAFDGVGNSKEASVGLTVDRTAPDAPVLTLTSTGVGTADLSWDEVDGASEYLIFYGDTSGEYLYGANVGDTTSYTVQGLGAGNYYFVVRAKDGAQNQSANSNEVTTGQIAGAPGTTPGIPAEGFAPAGEVQGATTDEEALATQDSPQSGDVLGSTADATNWLEYNLPWLLLVLQLLVILIAEHLLRRDQSFTKHLIALLMTGVSFGLFLLVGNSALYADGTLLKLLSAWFILISVVETVLAKAFSYAFIEEVA